MKQVPIGQIGMFGQERENKIRDFVVLLVQGEMAGVEQVDFSYPGDRA